MYMHTIVQKARSLLFIFLQGAHPLAQALAGCGGVPDERRDKLRVGRVLLADLGNVRWVDVVLKHKEKATITTYTDYIVEPLHNVTFGTSYSDHYREVSSKVINVLAL